MKQDEHIAYSSRQICRLAGVSYRQLDYWCRTGLIPGMEGSPGSGSRRIWDEDQLNRVQHLSEAAFLRSMPLEELADWLALRKQVVIRSVGHG